MAFARRCAGTFSSGSTRSRTDSMRCWRSRDQTANVQSLRIVALVGRERLQHALFEHLNLLLRVLECRLAEREQRGAALVGGERFGERQLAAFHPSDDRLELGERGFDTRRGFGCLGHEKTVILPNESGP